MTDCEIKVLLPRQVLLPMTTFSSTIHPLKLEEKSEVAKFAKLTQVYMKIH